MKHADILQTTARALVAASKGILAADESLPTIGKRFAALGIESSVATRRAYRELLFTTPGLGDFISGAILHDETAGQRTGLGESLTAVLAEQGIIPGVKVDAGTVGLTNFPGEKITGGLDGLRERLLAYRELGVRFTKWRAVIAIGDGLPTRTAVEGNARMLALFAAASQEAGLVPIVEPEILMTGSHSLERCEEVTLATLRAVFAALTEHRVLLEGLLLKTGMVLPGDTCPQPAEVGVVTEATLRCLRRAVPAAVPGVVFLSGGQADIAATVRLNALCQPGGIPWTLSFSFGRALQDAAMKRWSGEPDQTTAAQAELHHRARCNHLAVQGRYSEAAEAAKTT